MDFRALPDGSVQRVFECGRILEGYASTLHGGIICSLLDRAMTNCLAAHGHSALTTEMRGRIRRPFATERPATILAWIEWCQCECPHGEQGFERMRHQPEPSTDPVCSECARAEVEASLVPTCGMGCASGQACGCAVAGIA